MGSGFVEEGYSSILGVGWFQLQRMLCSWSLTTQWSLYEKCVCMFIQLLIEIVTKFFKDFASVYSILNLFATCFFFLFCSPL